MEFFTEYASPMGPLLLISDGGALTGLYMGRKTPETKTALPVFDRTARWLDAYFQGREEPVGFPVDARGTPFQKRVWEILLTIPYGQTRTYGSIARQIARETGREKMSAQAVGQAVGKNPISILIPCHRVVGTGGKLTGYTGGMENKVWLLDHEGCSLSRETR